MLPKVDETSLKILFLLLPGIIAFFVVKSVGPKRNYSDFDSGLQIFLYGMFSYVLAGFFEGLLSWLQSSYYRDDFYEKVVGNTLKLGTLNGQSGLAAGQIAFATVISFFLGVGLAVAQTHSVPHRVFRRLRLTKRTGENDMWGFTLNSTEIDSWVTVRHSNGKVYQGWVRGYSDGEDERELVLADVTVYAQDEDDMSVLIEVDAIPVLYLGLDRKEVVLECRVVDNAQMTGGDEHGQRAEAGADNRRDSQEKPKPTAENG